MSENETIEIKVGDIVILLSGGRRMVVYRIDFDFEKNKHIVCVWHDEKGRPCEACYSENVLEKVKL